MSDDLISRKALMEKAKDYFISPDGALRLIESQPTAYDVEKVIQKLENAKTNFIGMGTLQSAYFDKGIDKDIEIVKSGGVSDD